MGAFDIGIDLGTTKTIIYTDSGIILEEPSVVAIDTKEDTVIAVGAGAHAMFERTPPNITVSYPLIDGVVSNHVLTEVLLKEFLKKACGNNLIKHRVVICIPSIITNVERRTLVEVVINAGGRKVYLIEEPIAAAIGCGIDITRANGNLVVDIGGGTVDIAVLSMSGVVLSHSIKFAGNKTDEEIIKLIASRYKLHIGYKMAEKIKLEIGNVFVPSSNNYTDVKGRNLLTGLPSRIEINENDLYDAVSVFGNEVVNAIRYVLEKTPPELIGDIQENGIILTGGGSLMTGLKELVEQSANVKVVVADDPIRCVAKGTRKAFDYIGQLESGFTLESNMK